MGPYEVVSALGAGGMGEVYRARDTALRRDVAIKILPNSFATDADRIARFTREAQALAALNHTNIAHVYGLDRLDRTESSAAFIVMELVEGEDLAQRIARGPIPLDETIAIARQLADGLDAAHQQGLVHRDLKPANIKVRSDGTVKILDFGLAKAIDEAGPRMTGAEAIANSPTFTRLRQGYGEAGTEAGVILGTAAYMSPEQAKGKAVDKRADIWAFGVVLFEMLSGQSPFAGDSVAETIGFVATRDPDWRALPANTPPPIRHLLERCLTKDPRHRLRDIGDASFELQHALDAPARTPSAPSRGGVARWMTAGAMAAAVVSASAATWLWLTRDTPVRPRLARFDVNAPGLRLDAYQHPVISPDGSRIGWSAAGALWVRELDRSEARTLVADLDPMHLTWSPDSQEIMFFAKNRLWRARVSGGDPIEIADFGARRRGGSTPGAAWLEDGRIVFASAATGSGLLVVDSRGGTLQPFFERPPGTSDFHSPSPLPGNRGVLVVEDRDQRGADTISVIANGERRVVLQQEGDHFEAPIYSRDGYVLFERQVTGKGIWAIPFSLETLTSTGSPFPVLANRSWPSVSNDGTLLHTRGDSGFTGQLTLVSRDGRILRTIGERTPVLGFPRLSRDGRRAVVSHWGERGVLDIFVIDMSTGTSTRLTFGRDVLGAKWAGDRHVLFETGAPGTASPGYIGLVAAEGGGVVKQLVTDALEGEISPDRRWLLYYRATPDRGSNIMGQPLDPETLTPVGPEQPIVVTPANEAGPIFHPSGRFLLYRSAEGGQTELYLTRFPEAQGKWQISNGGGIAPRWTPNGDAVVFAQVDRLMEVPVTLEPTVTIGAPRVVLDARAMRPFVSAFDITPDGKSFLMVQRAQAPDQPTGMVSVVLNWAEEFKAK